MVFSKEELEQINYNGHVFSCMFFIGWIENRHPYERELGEILFFDDEDERDDLIEKVRRDRSYLGENPGEDEYLGMKLGEYQVEDGWINYDLGIRKGSYNL